MSVLRGDEMLMTRTGASLVADGLREGRKMNDVRRDIGLGVRSCSVSLRSRFGRSAPAFLHCPARDAHNTVSVRAHV
jgi:hypothetical protein